jgi:hypothetical protein
MQSTGIPEEEFPNSAYYHYQSKVATHVVFCLKISHKRTKVSTYPVRYILWIDRWMLRWADHAAL